MELILKNFSTGYSKNQVINKVNFKLKQKEWIGIIGANGSGKSTLLKGVLKFIPTLYGDVYFEDILYDFPNIYKFSMIFYKKMDASLYVFCKEKLNFSRARDHLTRL